MKRESSRSKILTRRALILAGGKLALLGSIAGRLYYLQVAQSSRYAMLADENRINIRLLAPPRALLADWKTGKRRESPDQLELGALLTFANDERIQEVTGVNVWLHHGGLGTPYVFWRADPWRWIPWLRKMGDIEKKDPAAEWERKPSGLCLYCPVKVCPEYRGG